MPELPEAQTIASDLNSALQGVTIADARILYRPIVQNPEPFLELCRGREILEVKRLGKMIHFRLAGDCHLLVSLRMTGQFLLGQSGRSASSAAAATAATTAYPPHVHAVFNLASAAGPQGEDALFYRDARKFGRLLMVAPGEFAATLAKLNLGPDPFEIDPERFAAALAHTQRAVKTVIMDQSLISGIGNIYAAEALFAAKIAPARPASSINIREASRILEKTRAILTEAIQLRGSTVSNYSAPFGPGSYQERHLVYRQKGAPCPVCRATLAQQAIGGRSTVFCPRCQK
ncbi:MAG: bifunctional DNA-formamidopyrimidine glycosylase/DNA-(apurinic or apyrimidinic site) lyase [Deltaproteobacteria bacterium]|jgi:formamidopyrimidine-DNA glycosylase|nr:bifunctional DNA-formamidopyrimidine glycosylase/DNA-(apurinic or apyrimidinic site) lyase [Deltaproteobacteria bacterium]